MSRSQQFPSGAAASVSPGSSLTVCLVYNFDSAFFWLSHSHPPPIRAPGCDARRWPVRGRDELLFQLVGLRLPMSPALCLRPGRRQAYFYSGGSLWTRFPTKQINPVNLQLPRASGGCRRDRSVRGLLQFQSTTDEIVATLKSRPGQQRDRPLAFPNSPIRVSIFGAWESAA